MPFKNCYVNFGAYNQYGELKHFAASQMDYALFHFLVLLQSLPALPEGVCVCVILFNLQMSPLPSRQS